MRDGQQCVRQAPSEVVFRQGTPAHGLNRREFGGAAMIASDIYRNLKQRGDAAELGPIFRPYPQNHITAVIKQCADHERKALGERFCYASAFRFYDIARALKGLDLSHTDPDLGHGVAPSGRVNLLPIGPQHNPTQLKITGLHQAADDIGTIGSARLECRIHIRQTRILELEWNAEGSQWQPVQTQGAASTGSAHVYKRHSPPSDWIPADIIPQEGIKIPIPQGQPEDKFATCILIEWREIHATGRRIRKLPKKAIVKIASLHAPAEAWQAPQQTNHNTQSHSKGASQSPAPSPQSPRPLDEPIQNPKAFLKAALNRLKTNPDHPNDASGVANP